MSALVNWRRRRRNRFGSELVTVRVVGETPAGYKIVEWQRNQRTFRAIVHPRNLETIHS